MASDTNQVTQLLAAWQSGDRNALEELTAMVYSELHRLAAAYLRRERRNHTLQPTALVNEAYMRLAGIEQKNWHSRAQFFAIAAHIMRQLLVEHARASGAKKRGGDQKKIPVDEAFNLGEAPDDELLALDEALSELSQVDERTGKIVELRYFAGMEIAEIADAMSLSVATVGRDLRVGLAWLHRFLNSGAP